MRRLLLLSLALVALILVSSHETEPAHYKYSEEANKRKPHDHQTLRMDAPHELWAETLGAILAISLAPLFIIYLIPDLSKHRCLLKVLLGFAAGGLLGDALLHLIPHALDSPDKDHHHRMEDIHEHDHNEHLHEHDPKEHLHKHDHSRHLFVGLWIVSGIFTFLCIEKFIRLLKHGSGSGHNHSHQQPQPHHNQSNEGHNKSKNKKKGVHADDHQKKESKAKTKPAEEFRVAGYLNLAADFAHNFTDGLAIGGSFLISRNVGMVTTLTVLLHELPHEIGDFAILIQSGCSPRKAILLQLATAIGAFMGASLSLAAAGVGFEGLTTTGLNLPVINKELVTSSILPFTAGGFIYIAMTSVLPDLLSSEDLLSPPSKRSEGFLRHFFQSLMEVVALIAGVGMMAALGSME